VNVGWVLALAIMSLVLALAALLLVLTLYRGREVSPQPTQQTLTPATVAIQMAREMRMTFESIAFGPLESRMSPPPTGMTATPPTGRETPTDWLRNAPLPPGVTALEERESDETRAQRLMKQREELWERLEQDRRLATDMGIDLGSLMSSSDPPSEGETDTEAAN
jgi:hypothetical protein